MISTSAAFKTAVDADQRRPETLVVVNFLDLVNTPTATASSTASGTSAAQAALGRIKVNDFTSSGHVPTSFSSMHKGWWSGVNSNATGSFSGSQQITVNYVNSISRRNFWFVADPYCYPVNFELWVESGTSGTMVREAVVTGNTKHIWSFRTSALKTFRSVQLIITKISSANSPVKIIHFGAVTKVIFEKDDIVDYKVLEETKSDSNNPVGNVTSNEFSMAINNELRWFSLENTESPFYGLIKPRILLEPYVGFETTTNNIEFVPLGKFKVLDWQAPSGSLESSLVAYDKLHEIMDRDIPMNLPIRDATTLKDLFIALFSSIGLSSSEYSIEDSISFSIPVGWLPSGKVGEALQTFIEAGNCAVFVDRLGVIKVKNNKQSGASIASLNDNNQIVSIDNPQRFLNTFSAVKVDYSKYYLAETGQIAFLDNANIVAGDNTFNEIKFTQGPIGNVVYVRLPESKYTTVKSITMGTWSMNLVLSSTAAETLNVEIYGKKLDASVMQAQAIDQTSVNSFGDRTYTISNPYIQSKTTAQSYCDSLIKFVTDPKAYFSIEARGNPALELLDIISVQSVSDKISPINLTIIKNEIVYNGGIEINLYARKVIS